MAAIMLTKKAISEIKRVMQDQGFSTENSRSVLKGFAV